ncbi:phage tail tape measure protein, partial [Peptoniphilus sp.]|uniref:phage tail tape measure protein n=1 Tax=Peptoniphilus sp. TaxID=1971214 RepID=UPI003D903376
MAGNIKGITIEIGGDTSKLDKALNGVNKTSRELNKELKEIKKSMKFNPDKSTELMAQQQRALSKAIENTSEKLKTLKTAQEQAKQALERGELGQDEYDALTREIMKTENQLKSFERQLNTLNSSWSQAGQKMQEFGTKLQGIGDKVTDIGKGMSTKITAPLTALGGYATKLAMDFDAAMSEVQAISGATAQDMETLSATARELGATTTFSAKEAADGMKYLAMAGWDVNQMTSAMPGLLNLAAASGTDLGRTADIVTDSLSGFGMKAEDAGRLADVMAVASSSANTNVEMMGETFKYVAPLAGALGYSVEDVAVVTGLMANSGIKAGQAGTAMRAAFTRLAAPTKEVEKGLALIGLRASDLQGLSLDKTIRILRAAFSGLSDTQKAQAASALFGQQAMSGMLAVLNASQDEYNALSDAVYNADGAAEQMAKTMNDNLSGSLKTLQSAAEEAGISLGEVLAPMIRDLAEKITELVNKFNGLSDQTKENIVKFGLFVAALGPVLVILGSIIGGAGKVIGVFGGIAEAIGVVANGAEASGPAVAGLAKIFTGVSKAGGLLKAGLIAVSGVIKGAMLSISASLGIPVAGVAVLAAVIAGLTVAIYQNWDLIKEKTLEVWTSIKEWLFETWTSITQVATEIFNGLAVIFQFVWEAIKEIFNVAWLAISTPLILAWEVFIATAETIWAALTAVFTTVWESVKQVTLSAWENIKGAILPIWESFKAKASEIFNAVKDVIVKAWEAVKSKSTEVWNSIKGVI